jgi:hypothetical protein
VQWQEAPWAAHAETTFRIVDSTLMVIATLGMLAVMCISTARRRRPIRHEGVHGTVRFQTELEIRRTSCRGDLQSPHSHGKRR